MLAVVDKIVRRYINSPMRAVSKLGGGYYGRVFLAETGEGLFVVKVYVKSGLAAKEALQLKTLATYSALKTPAVYFMHAADEHASNDALIMEYIPGVNAGGPNIKLNEADRRNIAWEIIDNLMVLHDTISPGGFGELEGNRKPDWNAFYKPSVCEILANARSMYEEGGLDYGVYSIMDRAYERFDDIFDSPIANARLVHGDYNTWNVLLSEDMKHAVAVIDPFNCRWADSEMDLYQLSNANGYEYGLLELYGKRRALSEKFPLKNSFYELYTEIMHYHGAHVSVNHKKAINEAEELNIQMHRFFG